MFRSSSRVLGTAGKDYVLGELRKEHFLSVYDACKAAFGDDSVEVVAHVTNRHLHQAHMSCQFKNSNFDFDLGVIGPQLQEQMEQFALSSFGNTLTVSFPDRAKLHLTFGPHGVSLVDLNRMKTEEERAPVRGAFGTDLLVFQRTLDVQVSWAAQEMLSAARSRLVEEAVPPPIFFQALAHRASREYGILEAFKIKTAAEHELWEHFGRPTINPALPGEDLNGLQSIHNMLSIHNIHAGVSEDYPR